MKLTMKLLDTPHYIVQQETAFDENFKFLKALMKTGKVKIHIPPDCFLWSGTKKELDSFMKEYRDK